MFKELQPLFLAFVLPSIVLAFVTIIFSRNKTEKAEGFAIVRPPLLEAMRVLGFTVFYWSAQVGASALFIAGTRNWKH